MPLTKVFLVSAGGSSFSFKPQRFYFFLKQVDYLQQANHDLEKQLKDTIDQHVDATKRANELEARNAELLLELKDIGRMSKRVEEDKERNAAVMRSELEETKVL